MGVEEGGRTPGGAAETERAAISNTSRCSASSESGRSPQDSFLSSWTLRTGPEASSLMLSTWTRSETEPLGVLRLCRKDNLVCTVGNTPSSRTSELQRLEHAYWTDPHCSWKTPNFFFWVKTNQKREEEGHECNKWFCWTGFRTGATFWCGTREGEEDQVELMTETDFLFSLSGSEMLVSLVCLHWFSPRGGSSRSRQLSVSFQDTQTALQQLEVPLQERSVSDWTGEGAGPQPEAVIGGWAWQNGVSSTYFLLHLSCDPLWPPCSWNIYGIDKTAATDVL